MYLIYKFLHFGKLSLFEVLGLNDMTPYQKPETDLRR